MIARTCAHCGALISDATATACPQCGMALAGAIPSIYAPLSNPAPPPPPGTPSLPSAPIMPSNAQPTIDTLLPATLVAQQHPPLPATLKQSPPTTPPSAPGVGTLPSLPIISLPAVPSMPAPRRAVAPVVPTPAVSASYAVRMWLVTGCAVVGLLVSAFGMWWWLFSPPAAYSAAMHEILAIIYASHVVWSLPTGILGNIMPGNQPLTEALTYQLLGVWLAIIPVGGAGAFWLAVRERRRGRHTGVWGDSFVVNLIVFVLGTVLLGVEEAAAPLLNGGSDPLRRQFLWAPMLVAALPYALVLLLVLALACSGAGTLLAALFARWRNVLPNPKASYRLICSVALVCVAALVSQAAIFQTILDAALRSASLTVIWYPVAAVIIVVLAAVATRGPTP